MREANDSICKSRYNPVLKGPFQKNTDLLCSSQCDCALGWKYAFLLCSGNLCNYFVSSCNIKIKLLLHQADGWAQ
jgi:hypothetical protein